MLLLCEQTKQSLESLENIHPLFKQIKALESELSSLRSRMSRFETLEKENRVLMKENAPLKEKLAKYENPKNSSNSSIPPSKDENRPFKSKSLRKKTGRKPGGQKGHEGTTLEMSSNPDEIIDHVPEYCECDTSLACCEVVHFDMEFIQKHAELIVACPVK